MPNVYTLSIGFAENIVLKLQSFAPDELTFSNPEITLARGDAVNAFLNGVCVFRGWVYDIKRRPYGKITQVSVTVHGPWISMRKRIYRQQWMALNEGVLGQQWLSKVILNMGADGLPATLATQVTEICTQAASLGKFTVGTITVPATNLPFDQQRSLTCEMALLRCLRYFPLLTSRFDYTTGAVLHIGVGAAIEWADPETTPHLEMESGETGEPVEGVVVEICSSEDSGGLQKSAIDYQTAGLIADENKVLQFQVDKQPGATTINYGRIHLECEEIPSGGPSAPAFWIAKHPRCAGLVWGSTLLAVREPLQSDVPYTYICDKPMKDLEAAGIRAKLVTFSCVVDIAIYSDGLLIDTEKDVHLSMDFFTTNKPTGDYSWIESSEGIAPEWIPDNLAETLLAQHAHDGEYINLAIPPATGISCRPGDTLNDLICREVTYDFKLDVMSASFGPPVALEPQDLAGLLTGWRNLSRQVSAASRLTGEPDGQINDHNTVSPVRVSDWKPGTKTLIGAAASGKSVVADPAALPSAGAASFRELIVHTPAGVKSHHVLCSAPAAPPAECELVEKELQLWTLEGLIKVKVAVRNYEVVVAAGTATARKILQVIPAPSGGSQTIGLDDNYFE